MQQDNQYLLDILHAAQRIVDYTAGTSLHSFYEDVQLQDKVICRLLTIGKTAQRISAATRQEIAVIAWPKLEKMKERLLQDDPVIDADQVWAIVCTEMPTLIDIVSTSVVSEGADILLCA
ncbi:MAG: HepT-like ribonuclease domain-containing protein [Cyanobacteria bacterium J06598_1]